MPWLSLLGTLIGQGLEHWRERGQAKHEANLEKIRNSAKWEEHMAKASESSWKDEYVLIIVSLPIWGIVFGSLTGDPAVNYRIGLAMNQLDALPDWYKFMTVTLFLGASGIRLGGKLTGMLRGRK